MAQLDNDGFFFSSCEQGEAIAHYAPGGYHPLILGDIIQSPTSESSYRLLNKLGFGNFSTVWLAETLHQHSSDTDSSHKLVTLKVSTAEISPTREAEVLAAVDSPHICRLFDSFTLEGPNGSHSVVVIEAVVPLLKYIENRGRGSTKQRKKIMYEAAKAIAELHNAGWVNGGVCPDSCACGVTIVLFQTANGNLKDLHLGNIGISIPQLNDNPDIEQVMDCVSLPDLTPVIPVDARNASPSLPAYVAEPRNLMGYYNRIVVDKDAEPVAKIFDFDTAHMVGDPPPTPSRGAIEAHAPEYVFAYKIEENKNPPIEPASDVWALGIMMYELHFGFDLFRMTAMRNFLPKISQLAPDAPAHWDINGRYPPQEQYPIDVDGWWDKRREELRAGSWKDDDANNLIRLLRRILVLDPLKRPSAMEVCQDDWFSDVRASEKYK